MTSSGLVSLFAGVGLSKQGTGKKAWIGKLLRILRFWGFTINRVYGDREFSTYNVLALLDIIDVPYTGSMKKTQGIRDVIDKYIDGECKSVAYHVLLPNQYVRLNMGSIPVHVILKIDKGTSIHALRKAFEEGTMIRAKMREKIHVFITTEQEPADSSKLV